MRKSDPLLARSSPVCTNSPRTLLRRRETGALTWRGPTLMLFARAALAVGAQGVVAAVFVLDGRPPHGTTLSHGCPCTGR